MKHYCLYQAENAKRIQPQSATFLSYFDFFPKEADNTKLSKAR
jgi:hypothetical protein